jgi:hypothetical protein
MAPMPNSFLCFSCAITYVIAQRKLLGIGAIAQKVPLHDHVRDRARKAKEIFGRLRHRGRDNGRKNASVDGP